MLILGINAFHADSAACLLQDGKLVAAAEEERFRRIKHWAGLPTESIQYCLNEARITPAEIDHIAINRDPRANPFRRLIFLLQHRPAFTLVWTRLRNLFAAQSIRAALARACHRDITAEVHHVEHHRAHLASAYFASGFEQAVCVSIDGCGDFTSTAWGMGNGKLSIHQRIYFPHSLGIFYSAITQLLGFRNFGDEYKVMGLAAYGRARYLKQMGQVLKLAAHGGFKLNLKFFRHHIEQVSYHWDNCAPKVGTLYTPELESLLGPARHEGDVVTPEHHDIAASAQAVYEEALFSLLNEAHKRCDCANLALAGGCALNSVANGKIYAHTPFKTIYVPPAAGDAGGAIGAALLVWHAKAESKKPTAEIREKRPTPCANHNTQHASGFWQIVPRIPDPDHAYSGPQFDDATVASLLLRRGLLHPNLFHSLAPGRDPVATTGTLTSTPRSASGRHRGAPFSEDVPESAYAVTHLDVGGLCVNTARAIAAGKIVGWFQGRMEWGPRALGNRSILCDPRRADMKQILNAKIKRRESFRPFAPAILRAHVTEWFEQDHDVPFMSAVFQVRRHKRALIPAVTHADGSGRLQTVHEITNPLFHRLICEFYSLTAVPLLLNTSFNEQEPIVCRPEEALDCFLRTNMDVLVLGGFFVSRCCKG